MVKPELGAPLREGHPGLGAEEAAQGPLPRSHGAAQLTQGAVAAGVFGQDGGDVAEALVTGLRQVELQRRGWFELMQRDPLQVVLLLAATGWVVSDRDDQLAEQAGDAEHGGLGQAERVDIHREGHGAHLGGAVGLVRVRHRGGQPYGTLRGNDPGPMRRGDDQHAAAGIKELLLGVVVPVDPLAVAQVLHGRPEQGPTVRQAVHRHNCTACR